MTIQWIKVIGLFLCCLSNVTITAQSSTCDCTTDINFLHEKIKQMPVYKMNKKEYTASYQKVLTALPTVQTNYECFSLMNRMLHPLNDNHAKIYGVLDSTEAVATNLLEKPMSELESLRESLATKPLKDKEGIYYGREGLEIAVYREKDADAYRAIILKTDASIWQVGELIYRFLPYGNDYLLGFGAKYSNKRLISFNERISQGRFLTLGWKKDKAMLNFSKSPYPDTSFYRLELTDEISYLKVGSFNSFYPKLAEAEAFYKTLENSLTKKHLILDLRDNPGGGARNSNILLKILKKYLKKNSVYVLTNHTMASNAEHFTMKITKLSDRCVTFGDRTNGTAAFEIKNSIFNLPCEKYIAVLTSKKHKKYLPIESQGITPLVYLDYERSWIEQVQEYIAKGF